MKNHFRFRAFTFLEIMMVVVIIGLLAAIAVSKFVGRMQQARIKTTQMTIANVESALDRFMMDHGRYPTGLDELVNPPQQAGVGMPAFYFEMMPLDAWSRAFVFYIPPEHIGRVYDFYSKGPNGTDDSGGDDDVIPERYLRAEEA